ncbi:PAAR domain-containing protein [Paraburkholderia gardini]|uniref:PAAR domain-containing protein n=1 Tax=Paraburkholderia gardini TaxID=2823469 RepID=A0ABN7QJS7_9BURK|nr:PAAR domain-containing protein [Paraburkholderia gardini]CAG4889708.1 hypothetical protein R54767_00800 [Paraburkholderia gardini]CAG4892189.1 hypothetical protein R69919_01323 [Paraburkholderia gardini]
MRKAAVRDGDSTTTGGRVMGSSKGYTDHGKKLALDGDVATCNNCTGTHRIFGTGKGISDKGRDVVVDGDSVLCPCGKNRVIVGSNPGYFLNSNRGFTGASSVVSAAQSALAKGASVASYDDQFILRDIDGHALTNTAYALRRETGGFEYGETDEKGYTHLLSSIAAAENIHVYLAG